VSVAGAARAAVRPGTYTGENRVPAALLLWVALVALSVARNGGKLPDQKHVIALGIATIVIAGAASIAPKFVFYVLLATALVVAFQNSALIADAIDTGTAKVREALGGG
jgi:hypothetical protein